jgi:hypothetical protein
MMMNYQHFSVPPGKHAVIVGKNGGGKSQQLMTLARNNTQRVVILDTKIDDDFLYLNDKNETLKVADSYLEMIRLLNKQDFDYLIVRPVDQELSDPEALDNYLKVLAGCKNLSIFIDEGYQFHNGGRAGSGYVSILTRGRSRRLSLIVCTQRPVWLSVFTFSEATYFFIYELNMLIDKKKLREFIPLADNFNLRKFYYYFYDTNEGVVIECEPVALFKPEKTPQKTSIFSVWGWKK